MERVHVPYYEISVRSGQKKSAVCIPNSKCENRNRFHLLKFGSLNVYLGVKVGVVSSHESMQNQKVYPLFVLK